MRRSIVAGALLALAMPSPVRAQEACASESLGSFEVSAVDDGRSFQLRDGRAIVLAGVEVPVEPAARTRLEQLILGRPVRLLQAAAEPDRYGRLPAQAITPANGRAVWVQAALLAEGQAQVGVRPGPAACLQALLAAEAPARRARRGIWANTAYAAMASDDTRGLLGRRGSFTVAEGKVLSVRDRGGTIYMNFGRVWARSLTVTIARRNRPAFAAAGMDPKKLEGARIRVRGFVEERSGPRMEAVRPEQIEIAARD